MQNISSAFKDHLSQEVTTLATCWYLKLKSGKELGFTDCDRDLLIENLIYYATAGFTPHAVSNNSRPQIAAMELEGVLNSEFIMENDILAGFYDHAEVEVFLINREDLAAGKMCLKKGWFGEVTLKNGLFVAEVKSLTQAFNQNIGKTYSPKCRAKFCDNACGLPAEQYIKHGKVSEVIDQYTIADTNRMEENDHFKHGVLTFVDGKNKDISVTIAEYRDRKFSFITPFLNKIEVGDEYKIQTGCDKNFSTCINKFNNAINFRGEPHVPGVGKLVNIL